MPAIVPSTARGVASPLSIAGEPLEILSRLSTPEVVTHSSESIARRVLQDAEGDCCLVDLDVLVVSTALDAVSRSPGDSWDICVIDEPSCVGGPGPPAGSVGTSAADAECLRNTSAG